MSNEATTEAKPAVETITIKIDGRECDVPKTMPDWQGKLGVTVIAVRHLPESQHDNRSAGSDRSDAPPPSSGAIETQFFQGPTPLKAVARYRPPAPDLSSERREEIWVKQKGRGGRSKKARSLWRQGQLPLEIVSKGRFEESEPTIHQGEDLDVPTYIRRGIRLN